MKLSLARKRKKIKRTNVVDYKTMDAVDNMTVFCDPFSL